MTATSMLDVQIALAQGKFADLIGCPEGLEVDFKLAPYDLTITKVKWELCKDVAALANSGAGVIVIGVRTERSAQHATESAVEIRPVSQAIVNLDQYRDLLADGITPPVDGLALRWYSDVRGNTLLAIHVPTQPERLKPFVLRRIVDNDGKKFEAFAIPRRNADRTDWTSADRVQTQLAAFLHLGSTVAATTQVEFPTPELLNERLANVVRELNATDKACLGIQIIPQSPIDLSAHLFGESGVLSVLRGWRGRRQEGFSLQEGEPQLRGTTVLFGDARWLGRVESDGVIELIIPALPDWLLRTPRHEEVRRINHLVLAEVVHDFFRLAERLLSILNAHAGARIRVRAWRMQRDEVLLYEGELRPPLSSSRYKSATTDDYTSEFGTAGVQAERDAFTALARIYALWGFSPDGVPFADNGTLDPDSFRWAS